MTKAVSNIHDGFFNGKSLVFSSTIRKKSILAYHIAFSGKDMNNLNLQLIPLQ